MINPINEIRIFISTQKIKGIRDMMHIIADREWAWLGGDEKGNIGKHIKRIDANIRMQKHVVHDKDLVRLRKKLVNEEREFLSSLKFRMDDRRETNGFERRYTKRRKNDELV